MPGSPAPGRALALWGLALLLGCEARHQIGAATPPGLDGVPGLPGYSRLLSPAGDYPDALVVADVDGDGRMDAILANSFVDRVSVLPGRGDGRFGPGQSLGVGQAQHLFSFDVADVNGDGRPDLVTADGVGQVWSGGPGGFELRGAFPGAPVSVLARDLDGDGNVDLVSVNRVIDTVSVALGRGDGGFPAATDYPTGRLPQALRIADVNGDGRPDVVVANRGDRSLSVLLNQGGGRLLPRLDVAAGDEVRALAIGDVSGDGVPDLVVARWYEDQVLVLVGTGLGTFVPGPVTRTGVTPNSLALGDVNGDGLQDLLVANLNGDTIGLHLGLAGGGFAAGREVAVGTNPTSVALSDINGDGLLDMLATTLNDDQLVVFASQR